MRWLIAVAAALLVTGVVVLGLWATPPAWPRRVTEVASGWELTDVVAVLGLVVAIAGLIVADQRGAHQAGASMAAGRHPAARHDYPAIGTKGLSAAAWHAREHGVQ